MPSGNAAATDRPIVMVSGGFDPCHSGHCHLIASAVFYGRIVVVVNSDEWLIRKKGYRLLPWDDRANVLLQFGNVADVVKVDDSDGTVCEALRRVKPDIFANGADRHDRQECAAFTSEHAVCQELGIREMFCVGGSVKMQSSSALVEAVRL